MMSDDMQLFKLDHEGQSYKAARDLYLNMNGFKKEFVQSLLPEQRIDPTVDMRKQVISFNKNLIEAAGFYHPVTLIKHGPESFPRAYEYLPEIYATNDRGNEGTPDLYVLSWVGYNGDYFTPPDATLIEDAHKKDSFLFRCERGMINTILNTTPRGAQLPNDFSELSRVIPTSDLVGHRHSYFVAQGRSLEILDTIKQDAENRDQAIAKLTKAVTKIITNKLPDQIKPQLGEGDGFRINLRPNGMRDQYCINIENDGATNKGDAGKALNLDENPYFHVVPQGSRAAHGYVILPKNNTAEGSELQRLMDKVPYVSSLSDYPELAADYRVDAKKLDTNFNITNKFPSVRDWQGMKVLVYTNDHPEDHSKFCPPDSIELPAEVYEWLEQDDMDNDHGVSLPPQPEEIHEMIVALRNRLKNANKPDIDPVQGLDL